MSDAKTVLKHVIKALGGARQTADALGVGLSAVQHWQVLPPKYLPRVSALTGISAAELRPDLVEKDAA